MLAVFTLIDYGALGCCLVCIGLWIGAHRRFWRRYRQVYPNRPAPSGAQLWLYKYLPYARSTRIVRTPQPDAALERARRWLLWAWNAAAVFGAIAGWLAVILSATTSAWH